MKNKLLKVMLTTFFLTSCSTTPSSFVSSQNELSTTTSEEDITIRYFRDNDGLYAYAIQGGYHPEVIVPSVSPTGETIEKIKHIQCGSLKRLILPETIIKIDPSSFICPYLSYIHLPNNLTEIEEKTFYHLRDLEEIDFPTKLTTIGESAFFACHSIENLVLPDSVTKVGNGAFQSCIGLKSISFSSNMNEIGVRCFDDCRSLKTITIPSHIEMLSESCFSYCGLNDVILEYGVKKISSGAFSFCSLKSIFIPKSVEIIGASVFSYNLDKDFTIYCEHESQPEGWDPLWNCKMSYNLYQQEELEYFPVVWNATREIANGGNA